MRITSHLPETIAFLQSIQYYIFCSIMHGQIPAWSLDTHHFLLKTAPLRIVRFHNALQMDPILCLSMMCSCKIWVQPVNSVLHFSPSRKSRSIEIDKRSGQHFFSSQKSISRYAPIYIANHFHSSVQHTSPTAMKGEVMNGMQISKLLTVLCIPL